MPLKSVLVIHGPNLNLLGEREPEIYGSLTLGEINARIRERAKKHGVRLRFFQSNSEGALVDFIHKNRKWAQGILINPAGLTHTSVVLRDALAAVGIPFVEVHLSDIKKREKFRHFSFLKDICEAQIAGKGWGSYTLGLDVLVKKYGRY